MFFYLSLLVAMVAMAHPVQAATPNYDWRAYAQQAQNRNLAHSVQWLRLGHWNQMLGAELEGMVDDPDFYLSEEGRRDPVEEMRATIKALSYPIQATDADKHAYCRFPARTAYLVQELALPADRLPSFDQCPLLLQYLQFNLATSVSVVFSSYYISNPASAFGHTFLRLNRPPISGETRQDLLHLGVDYAANPGKDNALIYAIKGFGGGYRGRYGFLPYYYKVREYADYESRDLWEYNLNLSDEALTRLILHLWEIGNSWYWYFFLHENCSYHILTALEAADPALQLSEQVEGLVVPAQTLQTLITSAGLVKSITFRPALRTVFDARLTLIPSHYRYLIDRVLANSAAPMPRDVTAGVEALILDAAADLNDIRHAEDIINRTTETTAARLKHALLARRAALGVISPAVESTAPQSGEPHRIHGFPRVGLRGGYLSTLGSYMELELRAGLHDLADPADGYPEQFDLAFMGTELRYYHEADQLRVHRITAVELKTLSPLSRFFSGTSYAVSAGAQWLQDLRCHACLAAAPRGTARVSYLSTTGKAMFYALAGLSLLGHREMQGIAASPLRASLMLDAGLRLRPTADLIALLSVQPAWSPWQIQPLAVDSSANLRWSFTHRASLDMLYRVTHTSHDGSLALYYYF